MQFKIASLLRCLLYVDATLVHPLSQVLFYASMIHRSLLSPKSAYMYFYNFASFSLCSSMNMQIPASPDSPPVSVSPTHLVVLLHRGRQQLQSLCFLKERKTSLYSQDCFETQKSRCRLFIITYNKKSLVPRAQQ